MINKIKIIYKKIKESKYCYYYVIGILFLIFFMVCMIPSSRGMKQYTFHIEQQKVCRFASVKAFYHNVGKSEADAKGLGKIFFNYGYKKFWIEYDGTVELTLNCEEIKISKNPLTNTVYVQLPKEILVENPKVLGNTMSDGITDRGLFTKITDEEKKAAKNQAKSTMVERAENDTDLKNYAMERSKSLIKNYIESIGKLNNKEYNVVFR